MPTRVRPSNAPNRTHHFPRNPPPPTTQTTLENSAIHFHCDPQHQPLWKDSLLGKKKLLRYKCLCACVTCSKKKEETYGLETRENEPTHCIFLKYFSNMVMELFAVSAFFSHQINFSLPVPLPSVRAA
ncbi:hypothetical protein DEO72_LG3g1230 [Vigna unguiculata]|uniref:Uncharacterized protein n=1 Tax=Vigna unguiculata TaxID=3917 RepID=A0A4D6LEF1_VIGUN|nr:hypothetical protein DEO72_LG3g1230 [Vigna unguiculata]